MTIASLDSKSLVKRLGELLGEERNVQVDFLLHLAEFRRRKAHEKLGYPNIWSWCRRTLGLSEGSTFRRIHASILLKRFPEAEPYLRDGRLCMSRLVKLEKVLTPANARALFDRASGASKRELAEIVAEFSPRPDPRPTIRKLPGRPTPAPQPPAADLAPLGEASPVVNTTAVLFDESSADEIPVTPGNAENDTSDLRLEGSDAAPQGPEVRAAHPPVISELQPIAAQRYLLRVAVGKEMVDEIDRAFDLLSHSISAGDLEGLLLRAVRGLVEREGKRKGALPVRAGKKTAGPIPAVEPPSDAEIDAATASGTSRGIPMETRRELYARDGGCCAWPLAEGDRPPTTFV